METLEFIIYPNGRIEERITGLSGSSCTEVTALIEAKLGIVAYRELTSENFVNSQQQLSSQKASQFEQVVDEDSSKFSQW
jgi:hypothetical protein